jgi:hypothetical protein
MKVKNISGMDICVDGRVLKSKDSMDVSKKTNEIKVLEQHKYVEVSK